MVSAKGIGILRLICHFGIMKRVFVSLVHSYSCDTCSSAVVDLIAALWSLASCLLGAYTVTGTDSANQVPLESDAHNEEEELSLTEASGQPTHHEPRGT